MNKAERELYNNYRYALLHIRHTRTIWDIYERPSDTKIQIYERLEDERISVSGYDACCPTHNGFFFTYAYKFTDPEGIEYLVYHTPTHTYRIILDDYYIERI